MPKSFLVKRCNSAQLGTRNWSELSDQLRGDLYVPEINPRILSISSKSGWDGGDPHSLLQPRATGKHPHSSKIRPIQNERPQENLIQGRSLPTQADFQCCVCSKRFPLQRMLNRHHKCHSSIKKRMCPYCSKGFNDTFDLKRHLRTHTGRRDAQKARHLRLPSPELCKLSLLVPAGIRPYRCRLCDKGFTQRCSLESHLKKIHGIPQSYGYRERRAKLFVCEECGFTCSASDEYYGHMRQGHSTSGFLGRDFPKPGPAGFQTPLPVLYRSVY
ncbi:putative transcription factor ovo-like protein 3 [Liasis olivaceus]